MVTGYNSNDFARRTKVMVDIDLNEVRNTRVPINLGINCDANYFLKKLQISVFVFISQKIGIFIVKILERNTQ